MAVKIQFRRDTAANWNAVATTVLSSGEVGYETDTGNIKIGDGTTQWQNLAYYQLPNVSVNPATSSDLNATNYRVMGRYRLNTVSSGMTLTNGPTDLDTADGDSVCTLLVTTHAYSALTTHVQQTLTQFSANATALKQWVRLYNGTNWTAWTSTAHLSAGEVVTATIADNAVTSAKLADDATTDANRAVTTDHIRDSAITTAKIASAAITTAKIADANVTTAKIADDAVTSAKLADDASTDANRAVTTNHIRDSAITTAKLASAAVTTDKFLAPQVVYVEVTTPSTYSMTGAVTAEASLAARVEIAPLSATITPRKNTHKVLVTFCISGESGLEVAGAYANGFVVTRQIGTGAATLIAIPTSASAGNRARFTKVIQYENGDAASTMQNHVISIVDSPATTSAVEYAVHFYGWVSSNPIERTFYLNRTVLDNANDQCERAISQTILQEIYA